MIDAEYLRNLQLTEQGKHIEADMELKVELERLAEAIRSYAMVHPFATSLLCQTKGNLLARVQAHLTVLDYTVIVRPQMGSEFEQDLFTIRIGWGTDLLL